MQVRFRNSEHLCCVQVLIRWAIQNGTSVIPKATGVSHIQGNLDALNFELSQEEFQVSTHCWATQCLLPMLSPAAMDHLCKAVRQYYIACRGQFFADGSWVGDGVGSLGVSLGYTQLD